MEYLIQWRMALAKDMLQREPMPLEKVAAAIGYEFASAFSTAFRRRIGRPPSHFARGRLAPQPDVSHADSVSASVSAVSLSALRMWRCS